MNLHAGYAASARFDARIIGPAALASAKLVKNATPKVYPGAPHGITDTHKEQLGADLLAFLKT
jgi:non-heme chloroperoxidase